MSTTTSSAAPLQDVSSTHHHRHHLGTLGGVLASMSTSRPPPAARAPLQDVSRAQHHRPPMAGSSSAPWAAFWVMIWASGTPSAPLRGHPAPIQEGRRHICSKTGGRGRGCPTTEAAVEGENGTVFSRWLLWFSISYKRFWAALYNRTPQIGGNFWHALHTNFGVCKIIHF